MFKYIYAIRRVGKRLKARNRTGYYIIKWILFGGSPRRYSSRYGRLAHGVRPFDQAKIVIMGGEQRRGQPFSNAGASPRNHSRHSSNIVSITTICGVCSPKISVCPVRR